MLLKKTYYLLKPAVPWKLRMAVRRVVAQRLRRRFVASWPINELAGRPPAWWPGWPDHKKFALVLTHDVEGKKGLDRCRHLAELEIRLGFRSSFNFVPEGEYRTSQTLREFLREHGFEVGVHDLRHDGKLYTSHKRFKAGARKINQYLSDWGASGFRSGLMFHNLDWLQDLNILYDASTFDTDPFEPQGDGVNTIFPLWVSRNNGSGYVELPYTLPQDSTVFILFRETTIDTWIRKLDWVAQHGGLALLDVHPDYMNFNGTTSVAEYSFHLYEQFLRYVLDRYRTDAWFALPRDVANYVKDHHQRLPQIGKNSSSAPARETAVTAAPNPLCRTWRLQGKRVGMVVFSFYPADPRPRRAAEALVSLGMPVDLICLRENVQDSKREVVNGIDIRRIAVKRRRGGMFEYLYQYSTFLIASATILALRSLVATYDIIYVHNMPDVLVWSGLLPKVLGAKVILDLHDPMPELMMTIFNLPPQAPMVRLLKLLEKWSIRLADSVVTVNLACAKLFSSRSCSSQKVTVVMNSPDEEIFRFRDVPVNRERDPLRPFVIMYHGSLVVRNGLDLAVEAFARVRQTIPNAELRIYGSQNAFLDRVMHSVRQVDLDHAVRYLGSKPLEEIVDAIEECDVGVIPNQRNIFTELNTPTRIFEYLSLGKPVIAPRAPGICDYFDDNSLIFFELGNAGDLAQKLNFVYWHPAEVTEIVNRGLEVHRAHTWREERLKLTHLVAGLVGHQDMGVPVHDQPAVAGPFDPA